MAGDLPARQFPVAELTNGTILRLSLLNFDVTDVQRYFPAFDEGRAARITGGIPGGLGAYLLVAVKRVHLVTSVRTLWSRPARVGAGLVEPTTRNGL